MSQAVPELLQASPPPAFPIHKRKMSATRKPHRLCLQDVPQWLPSMIFPSFIYGNRLMLSFWQVGRSSCSDTVQSTWLVIHLPGSVYLLHVLVLFMSKTWVFLRIPPNAFSLRDFPLLLHLGSAILSGSILDDLSWLLNSLSVFHQVSRWLR